MACASLLFSASSPARRIHGRPGRCMPAPGRIRGRGDDARDDRGGAARYGSWAAHWRRGMDLVWGEGAGGPLGPVEGRLPGLLRHFSSREPPLPGLRRSAHTSTTAQLQHRTALSPDVSLPPGHVQSPTETDPPSEGVGRALSL
jgi:hypothetical protein